MQAIASQRPAGCPLLVGVGAAVLEALFKGSLSVFRAEARRSSELRRALRDPRFPISPTKITLAVRLADQHPKFGTLARRLSCNQQIELLAVTNDASRADLARRSIAEGWNARVLALRLRLDGSTAGQGVGRPRGAADDRIVRELLERVRSPLLAEAVVRAPPERQRELARQLAEAARELRLLADAVGEFDGEREFPRRKSMSRPRHGVTPERGYGPGVGHPALESRS